MKKEFDDDDFEFGEGGGFLRIAIGGAVILVLIVIGCAVLFLGKDREKAPEVANDDNLFEEIDAGALLLSEDASTVAASEDSAESDASEQASLEVTTDASAMASSAEAQSSDEDNDPGAIAKTESGASVDVAQLVSASSVGENSNVTYGIDVSRFQGTINWEQVAGSGIEFAMVRVGYRDAKTGEIKADTNAKYKAGS